MSRVARSRLLAGTFLLALAFVLAACGGGGQGGGSQGGGVEAAQSINGAGASFPAPIYTEMFQQLAGDQGIQVNYQSIGSGAAGSSSCGKPWTLAPLTSR